jgi:pilus assembly protein FimV
LIAKSRRWRKTAMAIATTAFFGLWGSNAAALSLGRIVVQSALGEPLRAEIDVPDINAEEAASLKATVALPETFQAAGLDYSPALSGLQATLQRRADGRAYLRLSSDRSVNDPFVDMLLEVSWASGRIVRDYTMLFDPPSLRQTASAAPTPAQVPTQAQVSSVTPPRPVPSTLPLPATTQVIEPRKGIAKTTARATAPETSDAGSERVTVKSGDTAGKIAAATKPVNVSLDQMLVALLRTNPTAFMNGNINRVRAGAVLSIPAAEQAEATPAAEATRIITAQSKDFNAFRRQLAASAPSAQVATADRQANGSVHAKVEDKRPIATTPDKLTLSKGALQESPAEDQLARERRANEATERAAEIARNISDLNKLGATSSAVAAAPAASAAASPVEVVASAPRPTVSAAVHRPAAASQLPGTTSLVDELIENPLLPAGAVSSIALLAVFGLYRVRQRKKNAAQLDSTFLESRVQPDSFFAASGGQSVDTSDGAATDSSVLYSPSQLDAENDVDPVAEADVYLAYGRDLQAEEILRDALINNPERIAIHQKLLDIFSKRRDASNFEKIATQAFKLTGGEGADWARICELGLNVDPGNTLYQPGGQPGMQDRTPPRAASTDDTPTPADNADTPAPQTTPAPDSGAMDLDLDFSFDEESASTASETMADTAASKAGPRADESAAPPAIDLDFGLATQAVPPVEPPQPAATTDTFEFSLPDLETANIDLPLPPADSMEHESQATGGSGAVQPAPLPGSAPDATPAPDLSMLEFDLGTLSLDLGDTPAAEDTGTTPDTHEDPLATKLALAEEFSAIGDDDGARALIEEVISEASGDMKLKAQRALGKL